MKFHRMVWRYYLTFSHKVETYSRILKTWITLLLHQYFTWREHYAKCTSIILYISLWLSRSKRYVKEANEVCYCSFLITLINKYSTSLCIWTSELMNERLLLCGKREVDSSIIVPRKSTQQTNFSANYRIPHILLSEAFIDF